MSEEKKLGCGISYSQSGVDIATADSAKAKMAETLKTKNPRVLNSLGAFASLYDGKFADYREPVLVLKMEEPGTKQKLAFKHGHIKSICQDLVNHLVNDIAVMGAEPHAIQDVIVCGKLEEPVVTAIVKHMSDACRALGCELVGGETSEQPGVLEPGVYVLAASVVGVVERSKILDGSRIKAGDKVFALASNGLHTNGYSLVRRLLDTTPGLDTKPVGETSFLEAIMKPHTSYLEVFRKIRDREDLTGLAHITGGGIEGNLNRILPVGCNAEINPKSIRQLEIFNVLQEIAKIPDSEMRKTFNLGVGVAGVCRPEALQSIIAASNNAGIDAYEIGEIRAPKGAEKDQSVLFAE